LPAAPGPEGQLEEAAFTDSELRSQAASWQRRQRAVAAALHVAAQQQPQPGAACDQERLAQLQQQNLRCLQMLHTLHLMQMRQHLAAASALKAGQDGLAGGGALQPQQPEAGGS
jgi:hypothetical protein